MIDQVVLGLNRSIYDRGMRSNLRVSPAGRAVASNHWEPGHERCALHLPRACPNVRFASSALDFRRCQSVLDFIEVDLRLALGSPSELDDANFTFSLPTSELRGGALAGRQF